jgi:hypothetical protein
VTILPRLPPRPQPDRPHQLRLAELCPRFERCSAAYCPAAGGVHLKDERVCLYLREAVKRGGTAKIRGALPEKLAEAVLRDALRLLAGRGALSDALRRASRLGSKVDRGQRMHQMRGDGTAAAGAAPP